MPHSEIIHPQAPPPGTLHPMDPKSRDAQVVHSLGEQFRRSGEKLLSSFDIEGPRGNLAREIAARADKYASSLTRYWSFARERTADVYLHRNLGGQDWHADVAWFEERNNAFKQIDRTLGEQLTRWEELTSPYADKIDVVAISQASHDLRLTIELALDKVKVEKLPSGPQSSAEYSFNAQMSVVLAALSTQIGKRMEAIGNGKPQPVSATTQIREFLERASGKDSGKDDVGEQLKAEANQLEALRQEFFRGGFTANLLDQMRMQQAQLVDLLRNTGLSADQRNTYSLEKQRIDASLETWNRGVELVPMSKQQRDNLNSARIDFDQAVEKLAGNLSDEDRPGWITKREVRAAALLKLEAPFIDRAPEGVKRYAEAARDRSDRYQQTLADVRDTAGNFKKLDAFWGELKKRCLKEGRAVSDGIADSLDKAMDAGLANQLATWDRKFSTAGAAEAHSLVANLIETIDSYSTRAGYIMQGNPDLQPVQDRLQAGLQVIRESVNARLQRFFNQGVYGSPFS